MRWGESGLEYLGRRDHQIKLRGHRVELGEVEGALRGEAGVSQAVCVLQRAEDDLGGRLLAYVVGSPPEAGVDGSWETVLRAALSGRLPAYMIPSRIVRLDALPLSSAGKVDRLALPSPPEEATPAATPAGGDVIEEQVARLFGRVLDRTHVDLHQDFFSAGGHSLLAVQVINRIVEVFGVELAFKDFFANPTPASVAALLRQRREQAEGREHAEKGPVRTSSQRDDLAPASFAQQRLWLLEGLAPSRPTYNAPAAVRLDGELDVEALRRALDLVVARHEVLRTSLRLQQRELVQVVHEATAVPWEVLDLSGSPDVDGAIEAVLARWARTSFDLERGPALCAGLLRLGDRSHVLSLVTHHAFVDAWSMPILIGEVTAAYDAACRGLPARLPDLAIQYGDFARWQRRWFASGAGEQQRYWNRELAGVPTVLDVPTDRRRSAVLRGTGRLLPVALPELLLTKLERLSTEQGVTLYMTLLAAFQALLFKHTDQADFVVGTPTAIGATSRPSRSSVCSSTSCHSGRGWRPASRSAASWRWRGERCSTPWRIRSSPSTSWWPRLSCRWIDRVPLLFK